MMKRIRLAGAAGIAALALSVAIPATANAQPGPPPPPPGGGGGGGMYNQPVTTGDGYFWRGGFTGGVGLGIGEMRATCSNAVLDQVGNCDASHGALAFHLHGGFHLSPRLVIGLDAYTLAHFFDEYSTLYHNVGTVYLQGWLSPQLWIKGGLGGAQLREVVDDGYYYYYVDESEVAGALMLAAGYELLSAPSYSLDAQIRFATGFYGDRTFGVDVHNLSISIGLNFHQILAGGY